MNSKTPLAFLIIQNLNEFVKTFVWVYFCMVAIFVVKTASYLPDLVGIPCCVYTRPQGHCLGVTPTLTPHHVMTTNELYILPTTDFFSLWVLLNSAMALVGWCNGHTMFVVCWNTSTSSALFTHIVYQRGDHLLSSDSDIFSVFPAHLSVWCVEVWVCEVTIYCLFMFFCLIMPFIVHLCVSMLYTVQLFYIFCYKIFPLSSHAIQVKKKYNCFRCWQYYEPMAISLAEKNGLVLFFDVLCLI